jgi:hypothetical protein
VISLFTLPTYFPDDTLRPELAVGARIGTCLAVIKAFLAVTDFHLLAFDIGFTIRMVSALHNKITPSQSTLTS